MATEPAHLDRSGPILLGTFGTAAAPGALLRLPDGSVRRLVPGDTVAGERVLAIGDGVLILAEGGGNRTLHLPGNKPPSRLRGNVR